MKKIFIALDNMNKEEIFTLLDKTKGDISAIKIGLELFNKYGQSIVIDIYNKYKLDIFLDLKLHDIPNTVEKAINSLSGLPIEFLSIHLSGGLHMLRSSVKARDESIPNCKLLGVSVLTSLDKEDIKSIWCISRPEVLFSNLFKLAEKSKIDGVVCSPNELEILNGLNLSIYAVCPGIRFQDEIDAKSIGDQKRVLSPQEAISKGARYLVIGRSITQTKDLKKRIEEIKKMPKI